MNKVVNVIQVSQEAFPTEPTPAFFCGLFLPSVRLTNAIVVVVAIAIGLIKTRKKVVSNALKVKESRRCNQ